VLSSVFARVFELVFAIMIMWLALAVRWLCFGAVICWAALYPYMI
jgi:hypothetical protein